MGIPTIEVGYTSATTRRETSKSMTDVMALEEEEKEEEITEGEAWKISVLCGLYFCPFDLIARFSVWYYI
jgi:hypothetical protein